MARSHKNMVGGVKVVVGVRLLGMQSAFELGIGNYVTRLLQSGKAVHSPSKTKPGLRLET
jgi:hypothetical protein